VPTNKEWREASKLMSRSHWVDRTLIMR